VADPQGDGLPSVSVEEWRSRGKLVGLWAAVILMALFVAAHILGSAALLIDVLAHSPDRQAGIEWWKAAARRPSVVLRLLATDRDVQVYALGIGAVLGCLIALPWLESRSAPAKPKQSSQYGSHGTGRWATPAEITQAFGTTGPGAVLGRVRELGRWRTLIYSWDGVTRNRFLLIIGPPGSGKTSRYSLPNLLHAIQHDKRRSWVITDPKADLYRTTAAAFRGAGFKVWAINLINPRAGDRHNPLRYVHSVEDAFRMANAIISNTAGSSLTGEAFWINAERSLLACLIWYVKTSLSPEYQHLATVLHLGNAFAQDKELMKTVFEGDKVDHGAKAIYSTIASLSDKTRDGVFVGFAVRLQLWTSREIAALTADSDFDLRMIGGEPTVLYLIIPDHHATYQPITSLLFDQLFQELIGAADENGGRLKHDVRLMLEEMANIGRIPDLERRLATIRSRGIMVDMVLQTIGQLRTLYGDAWTTITGCADTVLALAANDQETAEWISKRLGTMTIRTTSVSSTATDRGDSSSHSEHYTSRALMLPDEVQGQGEEGLQPDELLVMQRSLPPARICKYPVDEFPGFRHLTPTDPKAHPTREWAAPLPEVKDLLPQAAHMNWLARNQKLKEGAK